MEKEETKGIEAIFILEIIGKPPEHLVETLENMIKQIDEEKGVSVKHKKVNEPVTMKENQNFYTSFAEIVVEVDEVINLAMLMFKYMPAHIEIISPELIALTNNNWNDILNEVIRRLHGYDEIARIIQVEKTILEKKLKGLMSEKKEKTEIDEDKEMAEKNEKQKKTEINKDEDKSLEKNDRI